MKKIIIISIMFLLFASSCLASMVIKSEYNPIIQLGSWHGTTTSCNVPYPNLAPNGLYCVYFSAADRDWETIETL